MNCPICEQPMEIYKIRTTYDRNRKEFQHTGYRCRENDTWGMTEIPKHLLPEEKRIEAIAK